MGVPVKAADYAGFHLIKRRQPVPLAQPVAVESGIFPANFGGGLLSISNDRPLSAEELWLAFQRRNSALLISLVPR